MTKGAFFYAFGLGVLLGTIVLHQLAQVELLTIGAGAALFFSALVAQRYVFLHQTPKVFRWAVMFLCGFGLAWALGGAQVYSRLQQQLPTLEENRIFRLQVLVQDLPDVRERSMQFNARVIAARPNHVPNTVQIRWFAPEWAGPYQMPKPYDFPQVRPGEIWQITAVLRTPYGAQNPHGYDSEQYTFAQGVRALATVRGTPIKLSDSVNLNNSTLRQLWLDEGSLVAGFPSGFSWLLWAQKIRAQLKESMRPLLKDHYWGKVVLALTIGDRSEFTDKDWELFNRAGLTHLISISGTHITLVAGSMGALALGFLRRIPISRNLLLSRQPAAVWAGIVTLVVAALYSAVAGWGVPARRSFFMLSIIVIGYLSRISLSISQLLLCAAVIIVLFDPWAILSTGFWLSFGAVATLLACDLWSGEPLQRFKQPLWQNRFRLLIKFVVWQAIITVLLWPLLVWFFAEFSLASVISNLYAITLLGTIATPISLLFALSVMVFDQGWLSHGLMQLSLWLIEWTMRPTQWLVEGSWAALHATRPPTWVVIVSLVGLGVAMVPRFWSGQRWFWLAVLPVLFWPQSRLKTGEWALDVLDVGQGLATVIRTREHTFIYDTGRRSSPLHDEAKRVLLPHLKALGVKSLDAVIISHADLDHIGGLRSLLENIPVRKLYGSFPFVQWWRIENQRLGTEIDFVAEQPELQFCRQGIEWEVDGVFFRFLWPQQPLRRIGRNSAERNSFSCVLEIRGAHDRMLLLGDINAKEELNLYKQGLLRSQSVVLAAHHGSRHASSPELIAATKPCFAVASVGWWNRFEHPHMDAVHRWHKSGSLLLNTKEWGAISFTSQAQGLTWHAQRWQQRRYWHHPQSVSMDKSTRLALSETALRCRRK